MRSIHLAGALALFLLPCVLLGAQDLPQTGIPPFATFNDSNFDQVNVGNFNDHFAIQMGSRPGRGHRGAG